MKMDITEIDEGFSLIKFTGEIIPEDQESIINPVRKLISQGFRTFFLEMEDVSYINSAGIGAVAATLKIVREVSGDIVLINPSDPVMSLLQITRLDTLFKICSGVEEALDEVRNF